MPMINGPVAWAKILGPAPKGKYNTEWSFDIGITPDSRKILEGLGCADSIKPKTNPKSGKDHVLGMDYVQFKRRETKADGTPAKPFDIVDKFRKPWAPDAAIGNGSTVNVKFAVNERQSGGFKPSAIALQVVDHVEYAGGEQFSTAEEKGEEWE